MKAVPNVLCSLGNFTARFPQIAPCLSLRPMKGAKLVARYVYSCFSWNCGQTCRTMNMVYLFVRLVRRPQRLVVGFTPYLTLIGLVEMN